MNVAMVASNLAALQRVGVPLREDRLLAAADGRIVTADGDVSGVLVTCPGGEVPLHVSADPVREALASLPANLESHALVVVVGAGAGYVLDALEDRCYGGRVLVLEPSATSCLAALARRDWTARIEGRRLAWLVGPDYDGWVEAWSWVRPGEVPAIIIHPVLGRVRPGDVRGALETLRKIVANASANERARLRFAAPYLLNTLHNLPHLLASRDAGALQGRFAGRPVALLAAGPSLNRNLEELAPVRDRCMVVAVDTALRPCIAAGIEPDLVVAVDPGLPNLRHLAVGMAPARTWLVAEPSVAPGSFEPFDGRCFTFRVGDHEPWPFLLKQGLGRSTLRAWGSVLTTALDFAVRSGASPVVLLGADFAFTANQPYCRGTVYEEEWAQWQQEGRTLDSIWQDWMDTATEEEYALDGTSVRTTPHLMAFRDWIANYCHRAGSDIFNGTGAGILRDVPACSIAALLSASLPFEPTGLIADVPPPERVSIQVPRLGHLPAEPWKTWEALTDLSPLTLAGLVSPET